MSDPDAIRSTVIRYIDMMCNNDIDGIVALFTQDATAEDPVGGEIFQGIEAIKKFYSATAPLLQVELTGPICVAGGECAFPLLATLTINDNKQYLDAIDVLRFDGEGRINSMRAFWNPAELRAER